MTTTVYQTYFWSKGLNVIGWGNEGLIKGGITPLTVMETKKKKKRIESFLFVKLFFT